MTTEPKHWILRDEHGCVLGAAVIHPHHLTEESAWESLAGDKRTPGMYLEKITSEQWDSEYRDRFGRCSGPSRPVAAVPAPVQGADPTGPQEFATGGVVASGDYRPPGDLYDTYEDAYDKEETTEGGHLAGLYAVDRAAYERGRAPERERADKAEAAVLEEIAERDDARGWADRLAEAIAPVEVIGEHSSTNNPWARAVGVASSLRERADEAQTEAESLHDMLADTQTWLAAERERADKAEAERDDARHAAAQARAGLTVEREAHERTRKREEAYAKLAEDAIATIPQPVGGGDQFLRLGDLSRRLAELRAGTEEAQS